VALTWLLKDWLVSATYVWTGAVVLGYALLEAEALKELSAHDLPLYFLYGLRMLVIVIPLHLGLHSLAWSIGALRLHEKRRLPWLRWTALLASLGFAGGWLLSGVLSGNNLPEWLRLLSYPIRAGLGAVNFLPGLGLAGLWMALGVSCLWILSSEMSLMRAYQETQGKQVIKTAMMMGASSLAQELKTRQRLGSGRMPSRFLLGQGRWALVSRNFAQALRGWSMSQLAAWAMIFGLSLGILLSPGWEARAFTSLLWILAVGQRVAISVRNDLSHWWLMKQIPYKMSHLVLTNLVLPLTAASLLNLLAMIVASRVVPGLPVYGWLIILPVTMGIGLATVVNLLFQCRSSQLLAGITPDLTFLTIVIGVLVMGVSVGSAWLLVERWALPAWGWIPLVSGITSGLDYGLFVIIQRLIVRVSFPRRS
jgi:hypothetical protein